MTVWTKIKALARRKQEKFQRVPATSAPRDIPLNNVSDWGSVGKVKAALQQFELGLFDQAAQLVDAFGRDDRLTGLESQRVKSLLGQPVNCAQETEDEATKAGPEQDAETWADENFSKIFPPEQLAQLLHWGHHLGVAVGEITWETREDQWLPQLRVWHPRFLQWRWDTRSYWISTLDGQVEVTPGDGRWVLYAPNGLQRGWMSGLARATAIPYLIRQFTYRDWARYSEVHGLPTRLGVVPTSATPEDTKRFAKELVSLATESTILVKQGLGPDGKNGFDVKLLEAVANGWEAFDKLIDKAEDSMAILWLGQTLTSGAKSGGLGTGGVAEVHERVRGDLLEFDARTLGECLRDQVFRPACQFNFGDPELAPYPRWELEPPEDLSASATTLNTFAQAVAGLHGAGIPMDVEKLCARFDVPLRKGADPNALAEQRTQNMMDSADAALEGAQAAAKNPGAGGGNDPPPSKRRAASGAFLSLKPEGFVKGQIYADDVTDSGQAHGAAAIRPNLDHILEIVKVSKDYEELRRHILAAFRGMQPDRLAEVVRKAVILADLNGRDAVAEET